MVIMRAEVAVHLLVFCARVAWGGFLDASLEPAGTPLDDATWAEYRRRKAPRSSSDGRGGGDGDGGDADGAPPAPPAARNESGHDDKGGVITFFMQLGEQKCGTSTMFQVCARSRYQSGARAKSPSLDDAQESATAPALEGSIRSARKITLAR